MIAQPRICESRKTSSFLFVETLASLAFFVVGFYVVQPQHSLVSSARSGVVSTDKGDQTKPNQTKPNQIRSTMPHLSLPSFSAAYYQLFAFFYLYLSPSLVIFMHPSIHTFIHFLLPGQFLSFPYRNDSLLEPLGHVHANLIRKPR